MATKVADCGCGSTDVSTKEDLVDEVLSEIKKFDERLVRDWLFSLDEQSMSEVKRLFTELNSLSIGDLVIEMRRNAACCPWKFIGSMFEPVVDSNEAGNVAPKEL